MAPPVPSSTSLALVPLLRLADVEPALREARAAVDEALRRSRPEPGETALRSAVASAALEQHPYELSEVRDGVVTDPVVQGALRVSATLVTLAARWRSAPRQVLARLHLLAARGSVDDADLGRPRPDLTPAGAARLDALVGVIGAPAAGVPALLRAAVVHGELLTLRPFEGPCGVVARAAGRLTLMADGLDPGGLLAPEVGHLAREPEYVGAANAFATGTPDGVRSWLCHCARAVEASVS